MQRAAHFQQADPAVRDLVAALPLYAASLVATLAGIGGVGVTVSSTTWLPVWAMLAVVGHAVSLVLRYARVSAETVFYPVMLLGGVVALQQVVMGGSLGGLEMAASGESIDMSTATVVGSLAVVRCFTLVTNGSLLFSPVPAITMLALVGSANLNAEVPVFFGLFLLASLFITGYEAHLRRTSRLGRPAGPVVFHLLTAWGIALSLGTVALLFPILLQPVLGQFSPFNLPGLNRMRQQTVIPRNSGAPVGQGPIRLSPIPVYEVYTPEAARLRTGIFTDYNGHEWRAGRFDPATDVLSSTLTEVEPIPSASTLTSYKHFLFDLPIDPAPPEVPQRTVTQRVLTRSYSSQGVPGLGQITQVRYPGSFLQRQMSGVLAGTGHTSEGKTFEVTSVIREPDPDLLRAAPRTGPEEAINPDTLSLPQSTLRVQELARRLTANARNDYDRVQTFLQYIEKNCTYSLEAEVTPAGEDATAHYLFTTKRGACDLAATSVAVMCRAVGIPAQVAVGYVMEEPLENRGGFLVRQEHAHMWMEAYFPGYGWIPFDPAPPATDIRDHPLQLLWYRLTGLLSKVGGGGLDALLALVVIAGTVFLGLSWAFTQIRNRLRAAARVRRVTGGSPAAGVAFAYTRALGVLDRRGWRRERWLTAAEFLGRLESEWADSPEALGKFARLTELFQQAHYGGDASEEDLQAARGVLRDLERITPRRARPRAVLRPAPEPAS